MLANLAFLLASSAMSAETFSTYGWRIPFLLSIALVLLAALIHFRLDDTPEFRELQQPGTLIATADACSPVLEAFRLYPRSILVAAGANVSGMLAFYILITYVVAYGTSADGLGLPRNFMLARC